ncbi:MAG: 2Fe-2S iron-sulfur cluster-binding protein [Candidatus Methylumidiphilus sp.]
MDAAAPVLSIDGQTVPFQPGDTVLQAALAAGLNIPHLCYHPEVGAIGSCRLCVVDVDGRKLSACTVPAAAGQAIASASPALRKLRSHIVSMLLEQGRHHCLHCARTGDCRLQDAATELNVPAAVPSASYIPPLDDSHPEVALDRGHCILCGVCIQASRELDHKNLFTFTGSGANTWLAVNSTSGLLQDSAIAPTDHAVRLCPVGALTVKSAPTENFASFDFFDTAAWGG